MIDCKCQCHKMKDIVACGYCGYRSVSGLIQEEEIEK